MNKLWGPFTIDRFASSRNTKTPRFNSLYWNPGSEGVDLFCPGLGGGEQLVGAPCSPDRKVYFAFDCMQSSGYINCSILAIFLFLGIFIQ